MNVLLGIPVYNEEENIFPFFDHLFSFIPKEIKKIIIINDGSTDNSPKLLEQIKNQYKSFYIDVIHRYPNQGYGSSMIYLLDYAKKNSFDYLITMDCDRQHKVEDLNKFIQQPENIDVVSGSRYLPESPECGIKPPIDRMKINTKITQKINQIYKFSITDSFCGFKRYKLKKINLNYFEEKGYGFPLEFWAYCYFFNLTIKEIPVARVYITDDRSFGENLDKYKIRYKYYLKVFKYSHQKFSKIDHSISLK
jgi:dolichol-phosphate mannosyltransferase